MRFKAVCVTKLYHRDIFPNTKGDDMFCKQFKTKPNIIQDNYFQ